jgi:hypothetical protein
LQDEGVLCSPIFDAYSYEEKQIPTSHLDRMGSIQPVYDSYELSFELDMQDFQEHTAEPCPLFINKNYHEEINHPGPTQDQENNFPMGPIYDDYDFDPWERHEEEKEQQKGHFGSYLELVSEKPSPERSHPFTHLHLPETFNHV